MKVTAIIPDRISTPVGGMGEQFKNTYKYLKNDIEINIVGYLDKETKQENYRGVTNPLPHLLHGNLNTLWGHIEYFYEALQYGKPDIVHSYDWTTYMAGYYLAKHFNVPLMLTVQLSAKGLESQGLMSCVDPLTPDGQWLHKCHIEMEKFCMVNADIVTSVSKAYKKYLPPSIEKKTVVIPNGIDLPQWQSTSDVSFPGKNKFKVVYIGRFAEMKGVKHLLEAKIPKEIDLIMVGHPDGGDGSIVGRMDELLKKQDNIFYVGPMYGQNKIDMLCAADAVIMPSTHEPFGIVALEALASKSILLSSRVDGMGDFLNEKNSIYAEPSADGIQKAFKEFLSLSESKKSMMVSEGIKTCKKYNWKNISKQYLNIYKSLL